MPPVKELIAPLLPKTTVPVVAGLVTFPKFMLLLAVSVIGVTIVTAALLDTVTAFATA
jgi:hypothetical protein